MDWSKLCGELSDFGYDLFNIETNTILKEGMTARKMPALPHALLDIVETYSDYLINEIGLDRRALWGLPPAGRETWVPVYARPGGRWEADGGWDSFDRMRWAAVAALGHPGAWDVPSRGAERRVTLARNWCNCDQLKGIIAGLAQRHEWAPLLGRTRKDVVEAITDRAGRAEHLPTAPAEYLITVRKAWDIGVELVVMQTVVQIDGDILTRIQQSLPENERESLLKVHERMVDTGARHWQTMSEMLARLVGDLGRALFR